MGRAHLRSLTLQACRSFQDRQTITFPRTGLVGVRGYNRDSGGSSGAGKSSIAVAIAYAFGYSPYPASKLQNWHSPLPLQVEVELDTPQGLSVLRRGKDFSLSVGGQTVKGSAKLVEEALAKLNGIPTNLMEVLTYRRQKKPIRFLTMSDDEKKELLGTLLGSNELEDQIAQAVTKSNTLQADYLKQCAIIEALKTQLGEEPQVPVYKDAGVTTGMLHAAEEKATKLQVEAAKLKAEVDRLHAEMKEACAQPFPDFVPQGRTDDLQAQYAEANRRVTALALLEQQEKATLKAHSAIHNQKIDALANELAQEGAIAKELGSLMAEVDTLRKALCHTCKRPWDESGKVLAEKEGAIAHLEGRLSQLAEIRKEREALIADREAKVNAWVQYSNQTLSNMVEIRSMIGKNIATEEAKNNEARARHEVERKNFVNTIRNEYLQKIMAVPSAEVERQWVEAVQAAESAKLDLRLLAAQNDAASKAYQAAKARYDKLKQDIAEKELAAQTTVKQAREEADYAAAVRAYMGSLFDQILVQISQATNDLLKRIPNTPTTTVTFSSESTTLKGKVNQRIKPVVTKNGIEIDLESGVSGGQLESIELAVDLSIVKVIGERTGVRPGFMIFDESFSAHCLPVKQACLEVLQMAAQDSLILVIDHATELRDYFTSFIDVESKRDVSRFMEG